MDRWSFVILWWNVKFSSRHFIAWKKYSKLFQNICEFIKKIYFRNSHSLFWYYLDTFSHFVQKSVFAVTEMGLYTQSGAKNCSKWLIFKYLLRSILFLFPDLFLILGCCFLIWSSHLSMICESACRLVNKVGKLPKNRLCLQDTGISEDNLNRFLYLWVHFMDIFIEVSRVFKIPI